MAFLTTPGKSAKHRQRTYHWNDHSPSLRRQQDQYRQYMLVVRLVVGFVVCVALVFSMSAMYLHTTLTNTPNSPAQNTLRQFHQPGLVNNKLKDRLLRQQLPKAADQNMTQRQTFEKAFPPSDRTRTQEAIRKLQQKRPQAHPNLLGYDVWNCPDEPPNGYPMEWPLQGNVLRDWNIDRFHIPDEIYQGLCTFDWNNPKDRIKVETYGDAQLPFVLRNYPDLARAAERWNSPKYMENLVGVSSNSTTFVTPHNHFLFVSVNRNVKIPENWTKPYREVSVTFSEWSEKSDVIEDLEDSLNVITPHLYFKLRGVKSDSTTEGDNEFLFDELSFIDPKIPDQLMVGNPNKADGLNCVFGSKGLVAECHFDLGENWILLLGGVRRYILSHPRECQHLGILPIDHPAGRHISFNWTDPPSMADGDHPFHHALANEVVLQTGEALYLPPMWFHTIVSLKKNYKCNARYGTDRKYFDEAIKQCGFEQLEFDIKYG